jgi:hypothetical protein
MGQYTTTNLNQGFQQVGVDSQSHADGAESHRARQQRSVSFTEGLRTRLIGAAGTGAQNIGTARGNTSAGMSKQSGDISDRTARFGTQLARGEDEASQTTTTTASGAQATADDVMIKTLNAG